MKFLKNKNIFQKIIIAVVAIAILSLIIPNYVHADNDILDFVGGTLLKPVINLLVGLGDVIMGIVQKSLFRNR